MTIHDKINMRALLSEFPKIGVEQFKRRFRSLKIGVTGNFERDFAIKSELKGGVVVMTVIYDYYGDFTHFGVGKGIGKGDKSIAKLVGSGRKAKPWKRGVSHLRYRLGEIYTDMLGQDLTKKVLDQIESGSIKSPLLLFDKMGK